MAFVDRTCSEVGTDGLATGEELLASQPLSHYAELPAWVLLGPPGAGKTVEFKREAARCGGCYVTARNFITLTEPDWGTRTLFIDALDEIRAGSPDGRTPLDRIRTKLDELGRPPFRLSCREADWFGASDRGHLAAVSPDGDVLELRLEPLSDEQIRDLLERQEADAEAVLQAAGKAGLSALLATPQDLELLAKAVASGGWPDTRLATFELACRQLAREQNEEHRIAAEGDPFATEQLLDAAGDLCAVALLSGHAGYAVASAGGDEHYIRLSPMRGSPRLLRDALHTRLFAYATPQHATPTHRQVAEFLAARRLTQTIRDGLPPARVMALMTGPDGGVVSSLRGLCAWLAAHSAEIRPDCIARDPLGTLLYGDVKEFTAPEKQQLVEAITRLARHNPWTLRNRFELDVRWGDLATPDTELTFRNILSASGQDDPEQTLARALLLALYHGSPNPALGGDLLDMVRNERLWSHIRALALRAFVKQFGDSGRTVRWQLLELLQDIEAGNVSDPYRNLLGVLLSHLYPKVVRPTQILRYLHEPDDPLSVSDYDHFWANDVVASATDTELGKLLDALTQSRSELIARDGYRHRPLAMQIFTQLLRGSMKVAAARLFDWLVVLSPHFTCEERALLYDWLGKNPGRRNALRVHADKESRTRKPVNVKRALAAEDVLAAVSGSDFPDAKDDLAKTPEPSNEVRRWQAFLRANRTQVKNNCPPGLLNELAKVYWGSMVLVEGDAPSARLTYLLQDDDLVQLALGAIRDTPKRADLPTFPEIATQRSNAPHPLALPYVAALDLLPASAAKNSLRLGLAFQFDALLQRADWYAETLKADPHLVASTLVDYCRGAFGCGSIPYWPLVQLAQDTGPTKVEELAKVAELASLEVLERFPPRCKAEHLPTLTHLLVAALNNVCHTGLASLVERKLSRRSLTAMQRVHWLCCGVTLAGARHLEPLLSLLAGRYQHQRIQRVVDLMLGVQQEGLRLPHGCVLRLDALKAPIVSRLAECLAERCPPASLFERTYSDGIPQSVADAARAADAVRRLLDHLASLATADATNALEQLAANDALSRWRPEVQNALTNQLATRREAEFSHASVDEVVATLGGAEPANTADLAALVADCLMSLASRVAAGDTSDWRLYWNTDGKRVTEPKHEELCRDALLSDLREELPSGVTAEPEAVHAADRRSDILVSFRDFAVPIEVKRCCNRNLWKALRAQLIDGYAKDPVAQGHGIYLVFWFGRKLCQGAPDGSQKPRTADELATRLRETLTPEERRKIAVVVVDVSGPAQIP